MAVKDEGLFQFRQHLLYETDFHVQEGFMKMQFEIFLLSLQPWTDEFALNQ